MQTTIDFLDSIKEKHNLTSDYQLAKFLGIRPNRISHYRHGKGSFDDATCLIIAEALEVDPGYVMACVNSERAIQPAVKNAWAHTAELLYGMAAVLVLTVSLSLVGTDRMSAPSMLLESYSGAVSEASGFLSSNIHYANIGTGQPGTVRGTVSPEIGRLT